jgi:hypothetical protein
MQEGDHGPVSDAGLSLGSTSGWQPRSVPGNSSGYERMTC